MQEEKQTDELIKLNESKNVLARILRNLNTKKDALRKEIKKKERIALSLRKSIKKNVGKVTSTKKTKLSLKFEKNKGRQRFCENS